MGGYYGYPYYRGYGWYGRKKRSTDEATAALPEDIEEVNHAPRDEAAESGPHGYYGWGRKKRNAEETIGDDISEGEEEAGPNPHYGYYYGGYRPWGYRGYGWGGYWGGYGYPYWG